jgi:CHASE2 domain-containing sensor protein
MQKHKLLIWTGRIAGLIISAFFVAFIFNDRLSESFKEQGKDLLQFLPFALFTIAGFVIAWFRPEIGGRLLMAGAALMIIYFLSYSDMKMAVGFGIPTLLVGLCFLGGGSRSLI